MEFNNDTKYKFCFHIKNLFLNSFVDNYLNNDKEVKNFYSARNISSSDSLKNYFDNYFIPRISLDWIALANPHNLSFSSINREGCVFTLNFNHLGNIMASSNHNHNIEIWDMKEKKLVKTLTDHTEIVTGLEYFHNEDKNMMTCSIDKTIKLWKDYECIHTFTEHSDWVRCLSISSSNKLFLSGCVSSIVKLWDLETQKVIQTISNPNPEPEVLNTVNSLAFMNHNENVFLSGLRNGMVKLYDTRMGSSSNPNGTIVQFKAHRNKLNTVKFSKMNTHLLTGGRDSAVRLWDFRNLPIGENIKNNTSYAIGEYSSHKCSGYNIDCNFFCGERYIITGSEDSFIYLYDINRKEPLKKYETHQKCINIVKPLPDNSPYSFAFTGLEDISIFIWNSNKVLTKEVEKSYALRHNVNLERAKEDDEMEVYEDKDSTQQVYMKLVEEVMSECGDLILKIFHSNNLTYSNGMNFENLINIIQSNNDTESLRIMKMVTSNI